MASRREKFPDTETFRFHNANPKNKFTSDCVIRALSTASDKPYNEVLTELVEYQIKTGYSLDDARCYGKYLEDNGWVKMSQPRKSDGTKYTGEEFCKRRANDYPIIAHIGGHHIVAIIGKQIYDTWDSSDGCIGNYFVKL